MTEELKQKAREWTRKTDNHLNAEKTHFLSEIEYAEKAYIAGATEATKELEAQIEKMKCCENCGWYYLQQHWRESKEINESRMFHCGTCGNKRNWKLKEIKENG